MRSVNRCEVVRMRDTCFLYVPELSLKASACTFPAHLWVLVAVDCPAERKKPWSGSSPMYLQGRGIRSPIDKKCTNIKWNKINKRGPFSCNILRRKDTTQLMSNSPFQPISAVMVQGKYPVESKDKQNNIAWLIWASEQTQTWIHLCSDLLIVRIRRLVQVNGETRAAGHGSGAPPVPQTSPSCLSCSVLPLDSWRSVTAHDPSFLSHALRLAQLPFHFLLSQVSPVWWCDTDKGRMV